MLPDVATARSLMSVQCSYFVGLCGALLRELEGFEDIGSFLCEVEHGAKALGIGLFVNICLSVVRDLAYD